ncbi:4-hydroxy-2-oxovalerate aldolase [Clostridium gasigenes]|uniref:4-hydroxy-2-oxovalerate aldolase n=1 Tax=Clostridium gasigenes TaxID=94869 RepID=A0A1H0TRQ3_9CLOT|nr:4-hydroxy-2-oxovalerate aldolase [Clostridium gasigenes]MBU3105322.1 4-hydroxy-2-oxovalerate aldolase [Clostridium gasigenes]MBU3132152.1 4-hydroxy-2-oxovalerate aldolase [Clostridium gasigenes]SDP56674.1 4-hydroxy 2-oxovalerate aldolase [Clostridium gasigenes]
MKKLLFFDSTLRDGSHAIKHQLTKENIADYCKAMDNSGMNTIIVGHGNGLGASSLQVGLSLFSDNEMLTTAKKHLKRTKLGVFLIPGFGTIKDDVVPAIEAGVDLFCVASHCTEADVTRQHIEYLRKEGKEVYGILMMYHMTTTEKLVEEAMKMQEYGAMGIVIMDSAGASTPDLVKRTINALVNKLDIRVGFHPHNNMGIAVSNALIAIEQGASIIDGTLRGFGAGAGNCQLEALVALLHKTGVNTGLNLYKMLDASEEIVSKIMDRDTGLSALSIISGMAEVFSSFAPHVKKAAEKFGVDPRDIFMELGNQKVVGGQEDMVIEIAMNLAQRKKQDDISYIFESLL